MKLISWNVNGIRAVYKKGAFDEFMKFDADIFGIQETKCTPDQLTEATTDTFHILTALKNAKGIRELRYTQRSSRKKLNTV